MEHPVAFFDIDGTVFRSSLLIELVEALIKAHVFPSDARYEYEEAYRAWQGREGSYEAYIDAVITTFIRHIRGVHYGVFADIGRQVVVVHSKRVYRYTRDLLRDLKHQGFTLIAISQSPKTILDEFCGQYGFDKVYGRIYEIGPQDRFTGVVTEEHLIQNKSSIVERVFARHPELSRIGAIAVGDTESDIPLLEAVERPICFNPNAALYAHAQARGWDVVVERKDVIYNL
ncbi:HAD-IB family phosphatase [Patescibacteria group bacterium]|nr:HAD-IB family phosphatase [Patescibacteria group bacterium]